jgi:hypothetical protein
MKKIYMLLFAATLLLGSACSRLDLNPLSEGSSENWYSTEVEVQLAVNDLFREAFWAKDKDLWSDDLSFRGEISATEDLAPMLASTLNAENATIKTLWANNYKTISRAIKVIENLDKVSGKVSQPNLIRFEANARFVRAAMYSRLIQHWGDVPFYLNSINLEEAYQTPKTSKAEILKAIYADFDYAATHLPLRYTATENAYATKGAALALKARIALYMGDYATAKKASQDCIELKVYTLNADFRSQFLSSVKNTSETVFALPRSVELGKYEAETKYYIPRNSGGFGSRNPDYGLFSSFLCADGLPIDKSPLYNPKKPFENRDPRFKETFVELGTRWLNITFQPHPDTLNVMNYKSGIMIKNNDNRANNVNAPFNGLMMKKGIDEDYSDDFMASPDLVIVRYADVLLMYAEAKIELGELDQSVVDAMNTIRARAYKVAPTNIAAYPSITLGSQAKMRSTLRFERRMELAFEGLRYMDIIRWKLAEKVLNTPIYGMLDVAELRTKVVRTGLWFFPGIPQIDENALPDFSAIAASGLLKQYGLRRFDPAKNYLWPIPASEILVNKNIVQNPNY